MNKKNQYQEMEEDVFSVEDVEDSHVTDIFKCTQNDVNGSGIELAVSFGSDSTAESSCSQEVPSNTTPQDPKRKRWMLLSCVALMLCVLFIALVGGLCGSGYCTNPRGDSQLTSFQAPTFDTNSTTTNPDDQPVIFTEPFSGSAQVVQTAPPIDLFDPTPVPPAETSTSTQSTSAPPSADTSTNIPPKITTTTITFAPETNTATQVPTTTTTTMSTDTVTTNTATQVPTTTSTTGSTTTSTTSTTTSTTSPMTPSMTTETVTASPTLWESTTRDISPREVLGHQVVIIDPSWSIIDIQATADTIFRQQENNEMGTERYSIYFLPGVYGSVEQPLMLRIGYYTEMAGLGATPEDVMIYGKIEVYNRCFEPDPYREGKFIPTADTNNGLCFALNSFWRSLANLSIQIVSKDQDQCRATAMFWAVSQASSMRRVDIRGGDVSLMDYCSNPAYASGGYIADTRATKIISGSQQQFFSRNLQITEWSGSVWNQLFMGVIGAPDDSTYPDPPFTTLPATPRKRDKPFLYMDVSSGEFFVRVPPLHEETAGVSWLSSSATITTGTGRDIPFSDFFVANPNDSAAVIKQHLAAGKHLMLTPGVYPIDETILVENDDTVILGLGMATLTSVGGATPLKVSNKPGIVVAGIIIDAGEDLATTLLEVGNPEDRFNEGHPTNPITLIDVYLRLGGPHIGKAEVCLKVNSNDVLIDHTWVWRADHGIERFDESDGFDGDNQRWATNIGTNGVIVNGDDVTAMGLFVEHFQEYNLIWNGERGRVFFFQNELPYDPPTQLDWMASDGTLGWAAYKVADSVSSHELWGGGVYSYNRNNPTIVTANGFEVPSDQQGVQLHRIFIRNLSGPGTIASVVNGLGEAVNSLVQGPHYVKDYTGTRTGAASFSHFGARPTTPISGPPPATPTTTTLSVARALGHQVIIFDPSWSVGDIQATTDSIFRVQQNNEMGRERYSVYFLPGVYGSVNEPLMLQVGYYTEIAGLGARPEDVVIYGKIEVYNRCFEADPYQQGKFIPTTDSNNGLCFALNSFWRSLANLSIQIVSKNQDSCRATAMFWAVSQASSMRRVDIRGGDVSLMDYCSNPAYASGGYIADTRAGKIISGSQQQFFSRNMQVTEWSGSVWNQVFMGVIGAPDDSRYPDPPFTTIEVSPRKRDRPFLYADASTGAFFVRVPSLQEETRGVSWSSPTGTPGRDIPFSDFFVAKPGDSAAVMNQHLANGKHLLFTPGVYGIDETILVDRADTVVLGLGMATLTSIGGATPLKLSNEPGIVVAGITVDAGEFMASTLVEVGNPEDKFAEGHATNPITLIDVYMRLGGPHIGKAAVCLTVNSNNVLIDHTWVWRADHGVEDFDESDGFDGDNQRWATNVGTNGVIVNGNDVTVMGLFVEHFQEYNLVWNGERGRVYFFQNELPYDPPTQADWTASDGTMGWAAYKVADSVVAHELWGGGVYSYNRNNPSIVTTNGFEVPKTPRINGGVKLHRIFTRNLSGPGTIASVVNGVGEPVNGVVQGPHYVKDFTATN